MTRIAAGIQDKDIGQGPNAELVVNSGVIRVGPDGPSLTAGQYGAGMYTAGTTDLRLISQTGTGTQVTLTATVPALTSLCVVYGRIDTVNDASTIWVSGTQAGTTSAAAHTSALTGISASLRMFAAQTSGRNMNGAYKAFGYTMGTGNRQKIEGYLAHQFGLTAALPSDHPHKTVPPLQ